MSPEHREAEVLLRIARQAGVDSRVLAECIEREILVAEGDDWDRRTYTILCRVRRLRSLGVNMAGVEVAMHMRRRMIEMQRELALARRELRRLQREQEREVARLMRELAREDEP